MTFIEAVLSGLRFRRAGDPHFYNLTVIKINGDGMVSRFVGAQELSDGWELEEKSAMISQSDLKAAINKATASCNLKQDDIKTIQDSILSEVSLK